MEVDKNRRKDDNYEKDENMEKERDGVADVRSFAHGNRDKL